MVSKQTVTLANSIVGVSVLAMPFCFKQCGIILACGMLFLGALITRTVCYFLLKAGTITRRRNYEMLAWDTFGQGGKFLVEISIIGFLIGTLIAFFVVMGDLGPEIISEIFQVENNSSLRIIIMSALCLFVALPLGLLRNIDSLSSVSTASVLFYVFLVFKILSEGVNPLFSGSYLDKVDYWRPAGVLQSIPIFSMALSCQTQIFGIYESLQDPSMQKMNDIVKQAITICTVFYFCVGFFGYIAFAHVGFGGNILMAFTPSGTTQLIKICFLMSIVFSVPLVVFPCRASLHSLIFRRVHLHHGLHDISTNYIPDGRLKFLTVVIIGFALITGILIPNIELVLGLVGSTTGTVICIIFPSIMFIRVTSKQTTERLLAQTIFFTGVITMVVSTYATLYAAEKTQLEDAELRVTEIIKAVNKGDGSNQNFQMPLDEDKIAKNHDEVVASLQNQQEEPKKEISKAPKALPSPNPNKNYLEMSNGNGKHINVIDIVEKERIQMKDNFDVHNHAENQQKVVGKPQDENESNKLLNVAEAKNDDNENNEKHDIPLVPEKAANNEKRVNATKTNENIDKIEGAEKIADENEKVPEMASDFLKTLKEHEENQKKLLEEQRQILAELKEHHDQDVQRQQQNVNPSPKNTNIQLQAKDKINNDKKSNVHVKSVQNVQGESKKELHVIEKEENLIEKLSENIEKGKENAEIIEKIEEGLHKEINKMQAEVGKDTKINFPDPRPPEHNVGANPIIVGDTVGNLLSKVNDHQINDPVIQYPQAKSLGRGNKENTIEHEKAIKLSADRIIKPIPIQLSEQREKDLQNQKNEHDENKISAINNKSVDDRKVKPNNNFQLTNEVINNKVNPQFGNQVNMKDASKSPSISKKQQEQSINNLKKSEPEEPAKQVDRDI